MADGARTRPAARAAVVALLLLAGSAACDAEREPPPPVLEAERPIPFPQVAITEVMAAPAAVPDERGEWVELVNLDRDTIDLAGWRLRSGGGEEHVLTAPLLVAPARFVVLGASTDTLVNGGVPVSRAWGGVQLADTSGWIAIVDPSGTVQDSVWWSAAPRGIALATEGAAHDDWNATGPGWGRATGAYGAGDLGSPGTPNQGVAPVPEPPPGVIDPQAPEGSPTAPTPDPPQLPPRAPVPPVPVQPLPGGEVRPPPR